MELKLCEKDFAKNENSVITAFAEKEDVQKYASNKFIENSFNGSLPGILASFFGKKKISESEANALKKLIDGYKE